MANLNALSPTADINSIIALVNAQGAATPAGTTTAPIAPEIFYSTQLLDTIRYGADQYSYYRYAEEMPIQGKADKLTVRRWAPLQAHTVPLTEGVPPTSDKGSVEQYEMEAFQYGRYMEFTDKVNFKAVDPVVAHYSAEYSIVAVETLDLLAQKELLRVASKYFANGATGFATNITTMTIANAKPRIADLRMIGIELKRALVKPRSNGKYHVLCSPEFVYDMLDDDYIQNYMKINQTTAQMYDNGALIPLFGFEFYEVINCPDSSEYVNASGNACVRTFTVDAGTGAVTYAVLEKTALNKDTVWSDKTGGFVKDSRTGQDASYIPAEAGAFNWIIPTDYEILKIQHTLILGKDALVKTGLAGEQSAKMYVKPLGSAGVIDPIDQRQSIGFKINSVGFASTRLEAVVDYMNIPTQLN